MGCTHTFSTLPVSRAVYEEIADLLRKVGYEHVFVDDAIDMMGIALVVRPDPCKVPPLGWRCTRVAGHAGPCAAVPEINLHDTFDARVWAAEFVRIHGGDEGLMLSWFANAIMAGHDHARRQAPEGS